jgi:DNA primase
LIPQAILDQVQDRSDIVEIMSQYIPLKRVGRNYKCNCPFHGEKTPSFVVSPDKQIFHCFGCGIGGNVISFLTKYEKMEFRDAVRMLAERAGIEIPDDEEFKKKRDDTEPLYEAHTAASNFYIRNLQKAKADSKVREYIRKRGLSDEALLEFKVGYSPDEWDAFLKSQRTNYGEETLTRAGLLVPKQGGGAYDRFRNRLMFPVLDLRGRVIAFGARVLDDTLPKYINSPETPIYHKGRVLYGLIHALDAIRETDSVIVVEGYMDVIACWQAGVKNSVATSGTAMTTDQIKLIKRFTSNVTVLYDSDQAGQIATLRGLDLLVEESCQIFVATMPKGHDPDSFVKEFGAARFKEKVLDQKQSLFEYKLNVLRQKYDASNVDGKVAIASEMLSTLSRIPNEILKASLVKELAVELRVSLDALQMELAKISKTTRRESVGEDLRRAFQSRTIRTTGQKKQMPSMMEKMLLGLVISFPSCLKRSKGKLGLNDFHNAHARTVAKVILDSSNDEEIMPAKIMNRMQDDEEASLLLRQAMHEVEHIENADKAFEDCLKSLDDGRRKEKIRKIQEQIAVCELNNDHESMHILMQEFMKETKRGKQTHGQA